MRTPLRRRRWRRPACARRRRAAVRAVVVASLPQRSRCHRLFPAPSLHGHHRWPAARCVVAGRDGKRYPPDSQRQATAPAARVRRTARRFRHRPGGRCHRRPGAGSARPAAIPGTGRARKGRHRPRRRH
ncbi:hypothetical protein G6F46_013969 [Rhizopus delemar]|nr:hypothetical protein G6F46_013969 [Rhizopus delemar]